MSDHTGSRLVLDALPPASTLIADCGYDSTWFREALTAKGIEIAVGTLITERPPHRSERAQFGHSAALAHHSAFIREYFGIADDQKFLCGISLGYADKDHAANSYRTNRAAPEEIVRMV